jgi:hypothetical protein
MIEKKVVGFLQEGIRDTSEIYVFINETMSHGASMNQLSNILSRSKRIAQVGTQRVVKPFIEGSHSIGLWELLNMSSESETIEKDVVARKLTEQLFELRSTRSGLTAEAKKIKDDEDDIVHELLELLRQEETNIITLDKRVGNTRVLVLGVRTGGGHFLNAWTKPALRLARNEIHAQEMQVGE